MVLLLFRSRHGPDMRASNRPTCGRRLHVAAAAAAGEGGGGGGQDGAVEEGGERHAVRPEDHGGGRILEEEAAEPLLLLRQSGDDELGLVGERAEKQGAGVAEAAELLVVEVDEDAMRHAGVEGLVGCAADAVGERDPTSVADPPVHLALPELDAGADGCHGPHGGISNLTPQFCFTSFLPLACSQAVQLLSINSFHC
jgi:hypothetical protein